MSMRKPENTSQARAAALNHVVMVKLYYKVQELYEKHSTADQILNVDETNYPVVLDPDKVISQAGIHQLFHYFNHMNAIQLYIIRLILCRCMVAKVVNEEVMLQCVPLSVPLVNSIQGFSFSP